MTPIAWPEAQRICDITEVREALDKFAADAHEENMLAMVSAIMGHASAQGRAAGLEEEQLAQRILEWIGKYGRENTATLLLYEAMKSLKARNLDAARYLWLVAQVPCNVADAVQSQGKHKDDLDAAIDAALSSLEVIGKGEKG